jgi:hypothetical protein
MTTRVVGQSCPFVMLQMMYAAFTLVYPPRHAALCLLKLGPNICAEVRHAEFAAALRQRYLQPRRRFSWPTTRQLHGGRAHRCFVCWAQRRFATDAGAR